MFIGLKCSFVETTCPPVPTVQHANVSTTLAMYNTYVTYFCQHNYMFEKYVSTLTIFCNASGNWSFTPSDCQGLT